VLIVVGLIAFGFATTHGLAARAWEAFLVNLLFWMGIAQAGVVASAAFYLTQGRWAGRTHYRLAEAFSAFSSRASFCSGVLYFGRESIFPWIRHPIPAKTTWLNVPFLFARDGIALAVITVLSLSFVSVSRGEEGPPVGGHFGQHPGLPPPRIRRLAPAVAISYAVVYSLLSFDLVVMSLSPLWHSTLFGWWFFAGTFWKRRCYNGVHGGLPAERAGQGQCLYRGPRAARFGKMVFAFSNLLVLYALRSIYRDLVRRHSDGDLFIALRVHYMPWAFMSWMTVTLVWAIPFVVLLGIRPKKTPAILGTVALLGMVGIWSEIYVLVVPSLSPRTVPLGWVEILVTAGFPGAFWLCSYPG